MLRACAGTHGPPHYVCPRAGTPSFEEGLQGPLCPGHKELATVFRPRLCLLQAVWPWGVPCPPLWASIPQCVKQVEQMVVQLRAHGGVGDLTVWLNLSRAM